MLIGILFVPRIFGVDPYVVTSGSMKPKYPVGSLIYVKKNIDPYKLKVGDAITFYMKDSYIVATHQIYKVDYENEMFYTQGINNFDSDGNIINDVDPVLFKNIIGKPIYVIPYLGYINNIITNKRGSLLIICITVCLILISCLLEKERGEKNEKK